MKKSVAEALKKKIEDAERSFSRADREFNLAAESFHYAKTVYASETAALVVFRKQPTRRLALAYFYWIPARGGYWNYFFVGYPHVQAMQHVADALKKVEAYNFEVRRNEEIE